VPRKQIRKAGVRGEGGALVAPMTTGSGGGILQVNGQTLRQTGERLTGLSEAVRALSSEVSSACSVAASACPGWRISAASSAAGSRWDRGVTTQASAVAGAGGKLVRSAANYATVESDLVARIAAIQFPGSGR
jgi:hypothetical protein